MTLPYRQASVDRARRLLRDATVPERLLWSRLRRRALGVRFLRQRSLGPYIVDFYARDLGLVVEIDGRSHTTERAAYDDRRQAWLGSQGLHVARVTNDDVLHHLDATVDTLRRLIETLSSDA